MRYRRFCGAFILASWFFGQATVAAGESTATAVDAAADLTAAIAEYLDCHRLALMGVEEQQVSVAFKTFCLTSVYPAEGLRPFWVTPAGPGDKAGIVLAFLKKAETEGLDPGNYEIEEISDLFSATDIYALAALDALLTFNLIKYIHEVGRGRLWVKEGETVEFAETAGDAFDPLAILQKALAAPDLAAYLESLPPAHPHYARLKKALARYREMEKKGGWPKVPDGKTLRPGDGDDRMPMIVGRLAATGDADPALVRTHESDRRYDPLLKPAVVAFQVRHGLAADGVIGPKTLAAMNVPAADRVKQILINMARWRWQAHDLGKKYILVNIANFDLLAYENGMEAFRLPVIVGKYQHQTPVFSDRIRLIVLNPHWNVPVSIARNEMLPKLRRNPNYLSGLGIRLFSGWGADAHQISAGNIHWHQVSPDGMARFRLRQDPGPRNPLGRVKFDFPNRYGVYLHDTPSKGLFSRTQRDFSHGCIRVSNPLKLALFATAGQSPQWTEELLKEKINTSKQIVIKLSDPLPMHITYQTSWVDKNDEIYFNNDIYGRDKTLMKALFHQ